MAIDGANNNQAKLQQKQDDFGTFVDRFNKTVPDRASRHSCNLSLKLCKNIADA